MLMRRVAISRQRSQTATIRRLKGKGKAGTGYSGAHAPKRTEGDSLSGESHPGLGCRVTLGDAENADDGGVRIISTGGGINQMNKMYQAGDSQLRRYSDVRKPVLINGQLKLWSLGMKYVRAFRKSGWREELLLCALQ